MSNTTKPAGQQGRKVAIVGGGIVGSCLARILSERGDAVTLIERGGDGSDGGKIEDRLPGSTGLAPGFIGQLHTIDALRILAQRTVAHYKTIPGAFAAVGGMEVACSQAGLDDLDKRLALAEQTGVSARMLTPQEAVALEPRLLRTSDGFGAAGGVLGAVLYPNDGTANARAVVQHEQERALKQGARLLHADVSSVSAGSVTLTSNETLAFDDVVVCSGIWTRGLLQRLPVHAVAHPYMYSKPHTGALSDSQRAAGSTPFIRWPQYHVYARDHGPCFGIGIYAHAPVLAGDASHATVPPNAKASWQPGFAETLRKAAQLIPDATVSQFGLTAAAEDDEAQPDRAFNGLFSVTPDGKPLAGLWENSTGSGRLYVCAAVWVTHAFGTAQWLANEMRNGDEEEHAHLRTALDPHRFEGADEEALLHQALSTYNDIYIKKQA